MAKQVVNIGTTLGDGTGDQARTAFDKLNDNFNEVYAAFGDGTTLGTIVVDFATISAVAGDWRGAGSETLATATTALEAAASAGVSDGDKGDVTVSGTGMTWTIDAGVVTNAKQANVATATLKGRVTAGTGVVEDLTAAQAKTVLGIVPGDVTGLATVASSGLATDINGVAHRVYYTNGSGDLTALAYGADGTYLRSNGASVAPSFTTPAGGGGLLNNFAASVRPAVSDDSGGGYARGSFWYVSSGANAGELYFCRAATVGAADWGQIPLGTAVTATKAIPALADAFPYFDSAASNAAVTGTYQSLIGNEPTGTALGTTGTIDLDVTALAGTEQRITLTGAITFTTSARVAGKVLKLRLAAGASTRTLAWPAGWVPVGAAMPTSLAANKVLWVTLKCGGTADSDIDAATAAQP